MIRQCSHCGRPNRVPASHLARNGQCGACHQALPALAEPLDVDETAFDDIVGGAGVPVLVDFWAPWCGPCKMAAPEVARTAAQLAGQALVLKVDTERQPRLAGRFGIRSIPTFAVFRGGRLLRQQAGLIPHGQLEQMLLAP